MNHKRLDLEKNENEIGRSHFSKFSLCLLFLFSVIQTIAYSQTPWSAAKLDQTVVLLEKKVGDKYIPHGTAFIIVSYEIDTKFYLVTNKHLMIHKSELYVSLKASKDFIEFTSDDEIKNEFTKLNLELTDGILRIRLSLTDTSLFRIHPTRDVAIIKFDIPSKIVPAPGDTIQIAEIRGIPRSSIKLRNDVITGLEVYMLGYPMGIGTKLGWLSTGEFSELIGNPVVRSGITAWVSNSNPYFLIDSFSYGGNSGSPVFARNIGNRGPFLIGIVCGHLGEELNEQNMSSGGNSGLAKCLFMDDVFTLIRSFDGDN